MEGLFSHLCARVKEKVNMGLIDGDTDSPLGLNRLVHLLLMAGREKRDR